MKRTLPILLLAVLLVACITLTACDFSISDYIKPQHSRHTYGSWETLSSPTCTEAGIEAAYCSECSRSITRDIDPLGHQLSDSGVCQRCGYRQPAPCITHIDDDHDGSCDRCGATTLVLCDHEDLDHNALCDLCGVFIDQSVPGYLTVAQVLAIGARMADNQTSVTHYGVQGIIVEAPTGDYGNCYIGDESGNRLYVYGIYDNGVRYGQTDLNFKVGDHVVLGGVIKLYVAGHSSTLELFQASVISHDVHEHSSHQYVAEQAPTCTTAGHTAGYLCDCGTIQTGVEAIAPLGHQFVDGICTRCGAFESCTHADSDNDGLCDLCGSRVTITVIAYGVNDQHGKFSHPTAGVGALSTYLRRERADAAALDQYTLTLSSGDMWQGTAESGLTKGAIITEWMNELDFVSMTLGNHEFDWGTGAITANAALAEFPFLGINVYLKSTGQRAPFAQPSVLKDFGEVQVGIIGAISDCVNSISGEFNQDLSFRTGTELSALIIAEATRLRSMGADIIIYSIHGEQDSTDDIMDYVDVIFEGHTHQRYSNKDSNGLWHIQSGAEGDGISNVELVYNMITGSVTVGTPAFVSNASLATYASDEVVPNLLAKYASSLAIMSDNLGKSKNTLNGYAVVDLVKRLYLEVGLEKWGDDYDIVCAGAKLSTRNPYNIFAGYVAYSDLYEILPFDNKIQLCSIKGSYLEDRFSSYAPVFSAYGESITIDRNKTYYVITDTYSSYYAWNNLTIVENYDTSTYARDLVAYYIQQGGLQ